MTTKILLSLITLAIFTTSCTNNKSTETNKEDPVQTKSVAASNDWLSQYDRIEPDELPDNVFQLIGKEWMLVTAGNKESFNTMTASWGGFSYVWERPASIMYIRDIRYTYQFLQKEESFTLSFFTEQYRGALNICGNRSGRDTDKIKDAGLTPIETPSGLMSFGEARMIIECKKILVQELDYNNLTDPYKKKIMEESYAGETAMHQLFISEITNIWVKK